MKPFSVVRPSFVSPFFVSLSFAALSLAYGAKLARRKNRRAVCAGLAAALLAFWVAGAPHAARADEDPPLTLIAVGDSLTQGYGLPQGEGLVPQLQDWLARHGRRVEIVNAGVSGDTTAGGLARIGWALTPASGAPAPDAVMVALGGNDLLRALPPDLTRANIDGILAEVRKRGLPVLLAGIAAPGNYGPAFQKSFDAIWPDMAAKYGAVLVPDLLAPLQALTPQERAAQGLIQGDGIHPSAAGVKLVVEALGPSVLALLAKVPPKG